MISEEERTRIESEIMQSVMNYAQALKDLDIEKAKEFYVPTEDILLSMDGRIIVGKDDVDEFLNTFSKSIKQMSEAQTDNIHIALLSREAATFTMAFRWSAITQEDETIHMKGTATYAMKKSDDKWQVVHLVGFHTPVENQEFADYYLTLARQAQSELFGPKRTEWLERLEQEHAHLRKALDWLWSHAMAKEGLQMVIALREFWLGGNHVTEGREYLSQFLTLPQALNRTNIRASALDLGGILAFWQSDQNNAVALVEESLAIRRELGDKQAIAFSLLHLGGYKLLFEEDYTTARDLLNESRIILEELDNNIGIAYANMNLGRLAIGQGDCSTAYPLLKASLMTFKDTENVWVKTFLLDDFSTLAACKDQPECAVRIAGASEALRESINSVYPLVLQSWFEGFIQPMKNKLGDKKSNSLWLEGRAMNLSEVLDYILENPNCFK